MGPGIVRSLVPARMDRLPWSPFHTRLVMALGVAWVLDGLEITIAGNVGAFLQRSDTLGLTSAEVGLSASVYLIGEVVGALFFGWMSDRMGRRKLFILTLAVYLIASGLTALSWDLGSYLVLRFIAGTGIGGEYAAVNSAIDEMIPSKYRGHVDLGVNGTYWLGALLATSATFVLLDPGGPLDPDWAWRLGFLIGPVIGVLIWGLRRHLPESPRWLMTHGREDEAEGVVAAIEKEVERETGAELPPVPEEQAIEVVPQKRLPLIEVARTLFRTYPRRSFLSATLMICQSFLYNAIFFTYALVLTHFYGIEAGDVPVYMFAFALGNLIGPLTLGRLFDTVGRRQMIAGTYITSGTLLAVTGWLFERGALTATTQTVMWSVIFFIASAAASSAYLTVSEIFPIEMRAQAISIFFALGQVVGSFGPAIFGALIGDQAHPDPTRLFWGYLFAAGMMIFAGIVEILFGVKAERTALEHVAEPLTAIEARARRTAERRAGETP
ncbi:MFS transporter [Nonomuraea typhae]|uniref:MFS transporter n=1 Tax=Nonomuraea typhae TaxID=2603600 RepID=UPI0012F9AEDF|nr:MFS transporter [Nonomuraea typhae]